MTLCCEPKEETRLMAQEMNTKTHIIATVMTGRGLYKGFRGEDWYSKRIEIFRDYVIDNLRHQTNQNFLHWIMFRPEEKEKKTTKLFLKSLDTIGYNYKATFHGQCWWDDKVDNSTLEERLLKSLEELDLPKTDYVYLTQLDSDDLLRLDVIDLIQKEDFSFRKALYHRKGYVHNLSTGQIADWYVPTCWESFTLMYPYDIFTDVKSNLQYQNGWTTHEETPKVFNGKELPDNTYMVSTGDLNISTKWGHPYMGREYYYETEKTKILKDFIWKDNAKPMGIKSYTHT